MPPSSSYAPRSNRNDFLRLASQVAGYCLVVTAGVVALVFALFLTLRLLALPAHACDAFVGGCVTTLHSRQLINSPIRNLIVGRRPRGCPHRYCGCAISLKVFGKIIPRLNLAWNWARTFPRTRAAAGMVAVRRGHVMLLLRHVAGTRWVTFDPNSGNGLTRIHVQSVAGFVFVNPHASQVAGVR